MEESSGGGLHTKTEREYQEAERFKRRRAQIVKREREGCRLNMDAQRDCSMTGTEQAKETGKGLKRKH